MKNPTIEISYEGQTKGTLRIGDEEIPVYLTEIVSKPLQSEIDWSLPCNFLCYPKKEHLRSGKSYEKDIYLAVNRGSTPVWM